MNVNIFDVFIIIFRLLTTIILQKKEKKIFKNILKSVKVNFENNLLNNYRNIIYKFIYFMYTNWIFYL